MTSSCSTTRRRRAWRRRSPRAGVHLVWRSHIGIDVPNEHVRDAWRFLLPDLGDVQAFIFTRLEYAPPELHDRDLTIIPPSIDAFSPKNQPMTPDQVVSILATAGIIDAPDDRPADLRASRRQRG